MRDSDSTSVAASPPRKMWWWIGGTIALVVATLVFALLPVGAPATPTAGNPPPLAGPSDITFGPPAAKVTLIEYADFECLTCAEYAPIMKQLRLDYGDRVLFVFRFVPLVQHQYGVLSAQAGYAAFLQGKFWEMADLLYDRQAEWSDSANPIEYFIAYAQFLGLDLDAFTRAASADTTIKFIEGEKSEALELGLRQTPSFFVDGQGVLPRSYNEFKTLLDDALDRVG